MKIITLRIYNSTPYYDAMYELHRKFDKNSVYLMACPTITEPTYNLEKCVLKVPGNESLIPGILEKTILGIQYCIQHFSFDILIRSNMSTIINYEELENQLSKITTHIYGGQIWSVVNKRLLMPVRHTFISGCCTVMDKIVCQSVVDGTYSLKYKPDDVAIGYYLHKIYNITFNSSYKETDEKKQGTCFYRFRKDRTRYDNREEDIQKMSKFYQLLTE